MVSCYSVPPQTHPGQQCCSGKLFQDNKNPHFQKKLNIPAPRFFRSMEKFIDGWLRLRTYSLVTQRQIDQRIKQKKKSARHPKKKKNCENVQRTRMNSLKKRGSDHRSKKERETYFSGMTNLSRDNQTKTRLPVKICLRMKTINAIQNAREMLDGSWTMLIAE